MGAESFYGRIKLAWRTSVLCSRVTMLVQEYRDYREALRTLKHLESEQMALLRELMSLRDQGYK